MKLYGDKKFKVIGINTDRDLEEYKKKAEDHEVTWRNAWSSSPGGGIPSAFGIRSFPTVILIDKHGVARWQDNFFGGNAEFEALLEELIAATE